MTSTSFLINDYIQNNDVNLKNIRETLYNQGVLTKDYEEDGLILLYNRFESKNKKPLEMECRSVILDRNNFNIISYTCNTPIMNIDAMNYILKTSEKKKEFYECYEGTLLSLFYFNDKWYLSTRRCLDSKKSMWNNRSYYDMFNDVLNLDNDDFESFTNKLDKKLSYYFILIHSDNKNIVDYSSYFGEGYTKLCLAIVRDENQDEVNLKNLELSILNDNIFLPKELENLDNLDEDNKNSLFLDSPKSEGIIVKIFDQNKIKYLKLQNVNYQFQCAIGIEKNMYTGLVHLYQKNKLVDFLKNNNNFEKYKKIANPKNENEKYDTIGIVDSIFKVLTSELFELYNILWNDQTNDHKNENLYKELPKEYKEVLFALRGVLYKNKFKFKNSNKLITLTKKDIYYHLKKLDSSEIVNLLRVRKLMFNLVKITDVNDLKIFSKISNNSDKVHLKLTAIYTNLLFPEILEDDVPK